MTNYNTLSKAVQAFGRAFPDYPVQSYTQDNETWLFTCIRPCGELLLVTVIHEGSNSWFVDCPMDNKSI